MHVDVVVNDNLPLGRVGSVQSTRILRQGSAPRYGHCEKQRVEARIVETLTKVAARLAADPLKAAANQIAGSIAATMRGNTAEIVPIKRRPGL
jgi:hypothetical protein